MIVFYFKPEDLTVIQMQENKRRTQEIVKKFFEAELELERLCEELGIPKPEIMCVGSN
jgi:hypothetical protein